ncbi:MAG: hypothetical protein K9L64_06545 [Candidatus Izimaplasma sp.]|nr:hypothetical protein [Candidatus Izimaplasma bacterium]
MKKFIVLILAIFGMFSIVSCNKSSSEETTNLTEEFNLDEQLDTPTNLAINGTTLTWSEVEYSTGYRIYVNGNLEAEVYNNSFDFSEVEGDNLIFTIKAITTTGLHNSNESVTIAYNANRSQEIAGIKTLLVSNNMIVSNPDGFAAELVDKGMVAADFGTMMSEFDTLRIQMESQNVSLSNMYEAIDGFMDSMNRYQIEALLSSLIKFELKAIIEEEIADMQDMEEQYGQDYSEEIMMNQNTLDFIEDNVDEVVKSAMLVVDYIVDVEESISTDLVTSFEGLAEAQSPNQASIDLAITLKNELVNDLKDSLPELEDVLILNRTLLAFLSTVYEGDFSIDTINVIKQSSQSLLGIELFYNYLLAIDASYVQGMLDTVDQSEYEVAENVIILNLTLLDEFLEDNQTLIQEMNDIYTVEEKEVMFFDYQVMLIANQIIIENAGLDKDDTSVIQSIFENNISYTEIFNAQVMMNDQLNELLDALVETDFKVITDVFAFAALDPDDFISIEDYYNAQKEYKFKMYNEIVNLINPIVQDMTLEEYQTSLDLGFDFLVSYYEIANLTDETFNMDEVELIKTGFQDTSENQLQLLKLVLNEFDDNDFWLVYSDLDIANTEESAYETMILIANTYINIYDAGGEAHLDAITLEVISIISDPDNMTTLNLTQTEVDEIEGMLTTFFEDIYNQANIIKDFDSNNLTLQQEEEIQIFIQSLLPFLFSGSGY